MREQDGYQRGLSVSVSHAAIHQEIGTSDEPVVRLPASAEWLSEATVAALCSHPQFAASVCGLVEKLTAGYAGNRLLNQVLSDRGRALLGLLVCYLDAQSSSLPGAGATLGSVQAICRVTKLCSPGRAAAIVVAMRFAGYVAAVPAGGRRSRLVPTEKLNAEHRRRWRLHYEAMLPVLPNATRVLRNFDDKRFLDALLLEMGRQYLAGYRILDYAPALSPIAESNAGLLMVSGLVTPSVVPATEAASIPVSISALSRRFSVARSHVRKVLRMAEQAGLLTRAEDGASVLALPALRDSVLRFFAVLFLLLDHCGAVAWTACATAGGSPPCGEEPVLRHSARMTGGGA
ncbi:MAG: hypothetical protein JO264_01875 [Acidisphaera sp.]|nr:hypothetical protein [Acidisphaera sp.]